MGAFRVWEPLKRESLSIDEWGMLPSWAKEIRTLEVYTVVHY